jgi:chromosome segregation ATPase
LKEVGIDFPRLSDATNNLQNEIKRIQDIEQEYPDQLASVPENQLEGCRQQGLEVTKAANTVLDRYKNLRFKERKGKELMAKLRVALVEDIETLGKDISACHTLIVQEYVYITL